MRHPAFNSVRLAQWHITLTKNNDQISESSSGLFSEIKKKVITMITFSAAGVWPSGRYAEP